MGLITHTSMAQRWLRYGYLALLMAVAQVMAPVARALDIPPSLAAWQGWVLDKHPDVKCARLSYSLSERVCVWPGRLVLALNDKGGTFSQSIRVDGAGWVGLPGDREHWPQGLTLNGHSVSALEKQGAPALWLDSGDYQLRGNFDWSVLPQALTLPSETALLDMSLNGSAVATPNLNGQRLWLRTPVAAEAGAHNSVKVDVFRKIRDDIPRVVETVLRISVSGQARELALGRFLIKNAEPIRFISPLPARIEDNGSLRLQARAGEWQIVMDARLLGDDNAFAIERQGDDWPPQEVWAFAAEPTLRRVKIDGAASVDPSQLNVPAGFENLPTYLLDAGSMLKLTQIYRGDATPAPNELTLNRTVWLDFGGGDTAVSAAKTTGATIKDRISGTLAQGWRLESAPAVRLGRVRVDDEPRLVTQLQKDGAEGVEIRNPHVNLEAISRIDDIAQLNAAGWQTDFNDVQMQLLLPPGWKLWHASGPDQVGSSWVSRWNLWAIFLSLLIVGAVFRLLDWRWAVVAAVTVALVYHERLSLLVLMLPILTAIALLGVVAAEKARHWIQRTGFVFGAFLIVALLAFAVNQMRRAIYPQLEIPYSILQGDAYGSADSAVMENKVISPAADMAEPTAKPAPMVSAKRQRVREESIQGVPVAMSSMAGGNTDIEPRKRYQPETNVQTGPGEPRWYWQPIQLRWSGPVKADQPLHLYMTGNGVTRLLKILNVLLVTALSLRLLQALLRTRSSSEAGSDIGNDRGVRSVSTLALLLVAGLALNSTPVRADVLSPQSLPDQTLLDELEARLLREPACAPDCSATESVLIQLADDQLTLKLRVAVNADLALPLPGATRWQPRSVIVDGLPTQAVSRGAGELMLIPLSKGSHEIVLEGPVHADDLTLQFSSRPHVIRARAEGWDVFGINDQMLAANSVQLQKRQRSAAQDTLLPAPEKPFVIVRRQLQLDLDWTVVTTVERVAPQSGAINLSVPTLPGESIISGGMEAKNGVVAVSFNSQQRALSWRSQLQQGAKLALSAAQSTQWVEIWQVDSSERWHVDGEGLVPIKNSGESTSRAWRPWPGEKLTLGLRQPLAVQGATTTVESSDVQLNPGKRSSTLDLTLNIRSSIGGDYRVALHEPNVLKSVTVNGADISQSRSDEKLVLPLVPGDNRVAIRWELERGAGVLTRMPALTLDTAGTNITLSLQLPRDRWPLWVSGPRIGPAMLYWGMLVVIVGVAIALGYLTRRFACSVPLQTWEWLLLFIGISTVNTVGSLTLLLWFGLIEARRRYFQRFVQAGEPLPNGSHRLWQLGIGLLSLVALVTLIQVIPQSLLSAPDMQVSGNGSSNYFYSWYQDRSGGALPSALVFSVPLWCYRIAMLGWSLWLVFALLRWVRWGWGIFAEGGVWPARIIRKTPPAGSSIPAAAPFVQTPTVQTPSAPTPSSTTDETDA